MHLPDPAACVQPTGTAVLRSSRPLCTLTQHMHASMQGGSRWSLLLRSSTEHARCQGDAPAAQHASELAHRYPLWMFGMQVRWLTEILCGCLARKCTGSQHKMIYIACACVLFC